MIIPETFECKKYRTPVILTERGCGKLYERMQRVNILAKKRDSTSFFNTHQPCLNCEIGKKNMEKLKSDTKTCEICGQEFQRKPGEFLWIWSKRKYCDVHSKMSAYQRQKKIKRLGIQQDKPRPVNIVKKEKIMDKMKKCSSCGKDFPRDEKHFDTDNRGNDNLTKECKICRGTASNDVEKTEKPTTIRCETCKREMPLDDKYLIPDPESETGFGPTCRECLKPGKIQSQEKKPGPFDIVDIEIFKAVKCGLPPEQYTGWLAGNLLEASHRANYHNRIREQCIAKVSFFGAELERVGQPEGEAR